MLLREAMMKGSIERCEYFASCCGLQALHGGGCSGTWIDSFTTGTSATARIERGHAASAESDMRWSRARCRSALRLSRWQGRQKVQPLGRTYSVSEVSS